MSEDPAKEALHQAEQAQNATWLATGSIHSFIAASASIILSLNPNAPKTQLKYLILSCSVGMILIMVSFLINRYSFQGTYMLLRFGDEKDHQEYCEKKKKNLKKWWYKSPIFYIEYLMYVVLVFVVVFFNIIFWKYT